MNTAEIVMREVQSNGSFQVRQPLAVSVRQARKAPNLHSHGEVLPFHKRRADVLRVGFPKSDFGYSLRDLWWGVPRVGAIVLTVIPEQFHKLGEIHVQPKAFRHGLLVEDKAVSRKLDATCEALVQIRAKRLRRVHRALASGSV